MHPYSTDSPANPKLIAFIALVAVAITAGLRLLFSVLQVDPGWLLGGISAMTFFGALYFLFDRWVWKWGAARKVLLVPDLNGVWRCEGQTVLKNGHEANFPWSGTIVISQSWSRIGIVLKAGQSDSQSIAASLYREPTGGEYRLIYHYHNVPKVDERQLVRHSGLCRLVFDGHGKTATGDYFTDRDRLTVGRMRLVREENRHA